MLNENINILNKKRLEGSVVDLSFTKSNLMIVDNAFNVYLLDAEELELIKNKKLSKSYGSIHRFTKAFALSKEGYISVPLPKSATSALVNYKDSLKKIATLKWHSADIEVSEFSNNGKHFATGGADGKVFLFDTESGNLLLSFPNRPDYISAISFGKSKELIAIGSFDHSVTVFDTSRNKLLAEFSLNDVVEDIIFYKNDDLLLIATRDGVSTIFDLEQKRVKSKKQNFQEWPTKIDITEDEHFAVIGTRQKNLYILDLNSNKISLTVKLDGIGISTLKFYKNNLYVGYIDGKLEVIDYFKHQEEFENFLNSRKFKEARELLEKNIFLRTHPLMEKFNESWDSILIIALDKISKGQTDEAYELVNPFLEDPQKSEKFNFYLAQKNHILAFVKSIKEKDYMVAYDIADDQPFLKELQDYKDLEAFWQKCFNAAKKFLQEDPELNRNKALQILKPFTAIKSKKTKIYNLVNNALKFVEADQAVKEKDFKKYFTLTESFAFLKDTDLYEKVIKFGEGMLVKFTEYEQSQQYKNALSIAKTLQIFVPFSDVVVERVKHIKAKLAFIQAVTTNNEKSAYEQVEKSPELKLLPQFITLEDKFKKTLESANYEAFQGYPSKVLAKFRNYMEIAYWEDKIASVVKLAYLNEIKSHSRDSDINWSDTFKEYLIRYGNDAEISQVAKFISREKSLKDLDIEPLERGYKQYGYLDSILVKKSEDEKLEDLDVDSLL